jgi:hypothetical protein
MIYLFRRPYYGGIIFFGSYLKSFIKKKNQVEDVEVRQYYWNKWKEHLRF